MPQQASHPMQHSFAQFCRDLQAKDGFSANPEEIANLATGFAAEFATKSQWRFDRHELRQRGPATRLQFIFQTDQNMTARLWTVFMSGRLRGMRGEILQGETPLSLSAFTPNCMMIEKRQITYLDDGRMQYVTIQKTWRTLMIRFGLTRPQFGQQPPPAQNRTTIFGSGILIQESIIGVPHFSNI